MTRLSVRTLVRSAGVGAIASLIDFTVLAALATGAGLGPRAASPFALVAGLAFQFVGNKVFAFEDKRPRWATQAVTFVLIELLAFCANLALFDVAVRWLPLPYLVVRMMTQSAVYFGLCLPLWSRLFERSAEGSKEVAS